MIKLIINFRRSTIDDYVSVCFSRLSPLWWWMHRLHLSALWSLFSFTRQVADTSCSGAEESRRPGRSAALSLRLC